MKKRLRKKFRTGEFTEFGFDVEFRMVPPFDPAAVEAMMDAFLDHLDGQRLAGGGSSGPKGDFSFFIASYRPRMAVTEVHRAAMEAWLAGNAGIVDAQVGPLVNAWGTGKLG